METIDEEVTAKALDFMERAKKADKPFFLWWNSTRMHIFTHLKKESAGKTGLGIYPDGMVEHDGHVGQVLAKLKELGLEENTIVMYSTDNGAERMSWPDGGTTMFRGEKNTNWEGGYRVPTLIRWPGVIKPGTDHQRHRRARGHAADAAGRGGRHHRQGGPAEGPDGRRHDLQGPHRRLQPAARAQGRGASGRARSSSTGPTTAASPRCATTSGRSPSCGRTPTDCTSGSSRSRCCAPRCSATCARDPFERAEYEGYGYNQWFAEHMFLFAPAGAYVGQWLQSFKEFPPRQKPGSFNLDRVMEAVMSNAGKQ